MVGAGPWHEWGAMPAVDGGDAAVDHEHLATDEAGVVAGEEQRRPGDLVGLPHAADGMETTHPLALSGGVAQAVEVARHHVGVDVGRRDGVDANAA